MKGNALVPVTTHVATATSRFLEQFRGATKLKALGASYVQQIQDLEDAAWEVLTLRALNSAEGVQLDILGRLVGQPRNAVNDSDYRLWLAARIALNLSNGTAEDLIRICRAALLNTTNFQLYDEPTDQTAMVLHDPLTGLAPNILAAILGSGDSAGNRLRLIYSPLVRSALRVFADANEGMVYNTLGLGDVEDAPWLSLVNTTWDSGDLLKVLGNNSVFDAYALSRLVLYASGEVTFKAQENTKDRIGGLTHVPDSAYTHLDYGIFLSATSKVWIIENGAIDQLGNAHGYSDGTVLKLRYTLLEGDAQRVDYFSDTTLLHSTIAAVTLPMSFAAYLKQLDSTLLDITFTGFTYTPTTPGALSSVIAS